MKRKAHGGAGSGSDGEATAGEMSDGAGPKKKIKIKSSGNKGTPSASRAGSPNPPRGSKCQVLPPVSLAWHLANPSFTGPVPGSPSGVVESSEILEKIPPEGITIGELIKFFAGRVGEKPGQMPKQDWIGLVKSLCDYGADKRLRKK